MEEILEVLEMLAIYCKTSECDRCRFTTHEEGTVKYGCNIDDLTRELDNCPCYWDLDKIKEILSRD